MSNHAAEMRYKCVFMLFVAGQVAPCTGGKLQSRVVILCEFLTMSDSFNLSLQIYLLIYKYWLVQVEIIYHICV